MAEVDEAPRWETTLVRHDCQSGEGQGTISGITLSSACSTNLDSVVCKCESVLANDRGLVQAAHANGNWCRDVNVCLLWHN